jgi:hypothetical protein
MTMCVIAMFVIVALIWVLQALPDEAAPPDGRKTVPADQAGGFPNS